MVWFLRIFAGSKTLRIATLVLVAILISFATIQWWERGIRNQALRDFEVERMKQNVETRGRVDEAIRNSPREFDGAVEWLRRRNSDR